MNIPPLNAPHPQCPACRGLGRIVLLTSANVCPDCRGTGYVGGMVAGAIHIEPLGGVVFRVEAAYTFEQAKTYAHMENRTGVEWSWAGIGYQSHGEGPR